MPYKLINTSFPIGEIVGIKSSEIGKHEELFSILFNIISEEIAEEGVENPKLIEKELLAMKPVEKQ